MLVVIYLMKGWAALKRPDITGAIGNKGDRTYCSP
jgi:hypothetical protein